MRTGENRGGGLDFRSDHDLRAAGALATIGAGLWASNYAALSSILLLIALALAIWRPVGAFWATCAAIPLIFHPIDLGSIQFSLLEVGILLSFIGMAIRMLPALRFSFLKSWVQSEQYLIVWVGGAALLIFGVVSLLWMPEPSQRDLALRNLRWVIVEPLMVFVVARYAIRSRGLFSVVLALSVPASVVAGGSLAGMLGGDRFEADGISRATGPYLHPNNLALYLDRIFVLFAGLLLSRSVAASPGRLLIIGSIGAGLLATFSRGMVPAVAAGLFLIGWIIENRKVFAAALVCLVAGAGLFAVAASDRLAGDSLESFLGERPHVWRASISMIFDYPASGIGLDQFLSHHAPRYIEPAAWSERYISHPHNIVLDSWLSLGAPGLILFTGGVLAIILKAWSFDRGRSDESPVQVAALGALVTGLVHGMVDNVYFLPDLAALTWILIAVVVTKPLQLELHGGLRQSTAEAPL